MFVVLPSVQPGNFATVIERAQVFFTRLKQTQLQLRQEIRSATQVLGAIENYWRLMVRLPTVVLAYKLRYRYRTRSGFFLRPQAKPNIQYKQEIRGEKNATSLFCFRGKSITRIRIKYEIEREKTLLALRICR